MPQQLGADGVAVVLAQRGKGVRRLVLEVIVGASREQVVGCPSNGILHAESREAVRGRRGLALGHR